MTNFENLYDNVLNTNNIDVILSTLKEKKLKERDSESNLKNNSESLLNKLEQCKKKIVKDDQNREKGVSTQKADKTKSIKDRLNEKKEHVKQHDELQKKEDVKVNKENYTR